MMKWNPTQMLCPLCNKTNDSHNHLFFQCDFSMAIWGSMKMKMSIDNLPDEWNNVVVMMEDMQCNNNIWSVLNKLIIATTVYYIWKERNERLFSQNVKTTEVVLHVIQEQIRLQLLSLQVKKTIHTTKVADVWKIKFNHAE